MSYLTTLRRIPDDEFLWIFAGDFNNNYGPRCICGRALQASFLRAAPALDEQGAECMAENVGWDIVPRLVVRFGGDTEEWNDLYMHASSFSGQMPFVEAAVVDRLNEIVS